MVKRHPIARIILAQKRRRVSKVLKNYDFSANWKTTLLPLIRTVEVQTAILKGMEFSFKYDPTKSPSRFITSDGMCGIDLHREQQFLKKWEKEGRLPPEFLALKKMADEQEDIYEGHEGVIYRDLYHNALKKLREKLEAEDGYKWQDQLESYVVLHQCHTWNPTFGLTLARLAEPTEKWRVVRTEKHTTVMNRDKTKCFDILAWACDSNRLVDHIFGSDYNEELPSWPDYRTIRRNYEADATFGGQLVAQMLRS